MINEGTDESVETSISNKQTSEHESTSSSPSSLSNVTDPKDYYSKFYILKTDLGVGNQKDSTVKFGSDFVPFGSSSIKMAGDMSEDISESETEFTTEKKTLAKRYKRKHQDTNSSRDYKQNKKFKKEDNDNDQRSQTGIKFDSFKSAVIEKCFGKPNKKKKQKRVKLGSSVKRS